MRRRTASSTLRGTRNSSVGSPCSREGSTSSMKNGLPSANFVTVSSRFRRTGRSRPRMACSIASICSRSSGPSPISAVSRRRSSSARNWSSSCAASSLRYVSSSTAARLGTARARWTRKSSVVRSLQWTSSMTSSTGSRSSRYCPRAWKSRRLSCSGSRFGSEANPGSRTWSSGSSLRSSKAAEPSSSTSCSSVSCAKWLRSMSCNGPYGSARSCSKQPPWRILKPELAARALSSAARRDLPIPASPATSTACPRPPRAWSRRLINAESSSARPISTGERNLGSIACLPSVRLITRSTPRVVSRAHCGTLKLRPKPPYISEENWIYSFAWHCDAPGRDRSRGPNAVLLRSTECLQDVPWRLCRGGHCVMGSFLDHFWVPRRLSKR
jgi:hypothetical protein